MIDLDELERLHKAATKGEWEFDTEYDPDAAYGSGPDHDTGFKNYFIGATVPNGTEHGRWATLFDSVNSDHKLIEEDFDEDGRSAWDAIGWANAVSIVALHNAAPALIAAARERDTLRVERDFLLARAGHAGSCSFAPGRWTGSSSNALVTVAFGGEDDALPYDTSDLAACYRTMLRLPRHLLSEKVWQQLEAGERFVGKHHDIAFARDAAGWTDEARAALKETSHEGQE